MNFSAVKCGQRGTGHVSVWLITCDKYLLHVGPIYYLFSPSHKTNIQHLVAWTSLISYFFTFSRIGFRNKYAKDHLGKMLKGTVPRKSTWAVDVHFSEKTTMVPFIWVWNTCWHSSYTNQSWDYLVYLRDLAVHEENFPHHRMTSQSAMA